MRSFALLFMLASATLAACGDEGKRPLGEECASDAQCESGICGGSVCLDPEGDEDLDGLTNSVEANLGSNPIDRDTDADGIEDGDEVDQVINVDTDGDGEADIIESATFDEDDDCIPDQFDARNTQPDSDLSPMIGVVCSEAGVCAGQRGLMQVECSTGTARCVYGSVAGYANPETACDGIDQNCDGVADDGLPDRDGDAIADCVDVDWDNDSVADETDNCPTVANQDQADGDEDGIGNACVTSYALAFVTSPTEVTAGVAFGASVGLTFIGSDDDAPQPTFGGQITLTLAGDASLTGTLTRGVEDGVATFDDLIVDAAAAGLVLVATSGDLSGARSSAFESVAGVASQFTFDELPATAAAGAVLGFELVARDANGNVIDDYTGTVTFASSDTRAALPGAYTFLAGDNGRHTFGGIVLETAGVQTITATDGDITSDGAVTITAGAFDGLRIDAADTVVSGADLVFEVVAEDRFGNTITTYAETIALETTDEGADLPATLAPSIATPGRYSGVMEAAFAGEHQLTASVGPVSATHAYVVNPGVAASLELEAPATIGAAVAFDATVTLRDGFGNVATGFRGTVTLGSDDAAAVADMPAPHTFVAADEGAFVFEGVTLATARVTTLRAATDGLSDELDINVVAGDAATLTIVAAPSTVVAGQAFSITAEFRDAAGNLASETTRNVTVTGEDMELRNLDATGASVVISNVVLTQASAATTVVVASPTFGLSDSVEIAVTPGPATKLTVSGPAAATAGDAFDVTVSARDQYDNIAPDYRGVVRFTTNDPATDPAAVVPNDYTFTAADAGTHTFVGGVTLYTASASALRVTVTDLTPIAAPTAFIDVSIGGGAATSLVLTGPASAVAGTPFEVTATVYDANGNIASGYAGTVTLTTPAVPNRPAAVLPAAYTFTAADGGRHVFTGADRVTLFAAGSIVVTATDATPLPEAVSTLTVVVAPAAAARLSVSSDATGNPVAGAPFGITVTALDAHGNTATGYLGRVVFTTNDTHLTPAPVLPASYTFVAADAGVRAFTPVTLYMAGARTITATDQTPIATPADVLSLTVDPGAASKLRFVGQPSNGVAGVALAPAVTVEVADTFDNRVVSTATIDIAVVTNPGRAVPVNGQAAAVAGLASFPTLSLDRPGAGYVLRATTTGLTAGLSDAFDLVWQAPTVTAPTLTPQGNCVAVGYTASHNLARPIDVIVEYDLTNDSPDAGWRTATQCGDSPQAAIGGAGVNGLHVTATAAPYTFNWNALKDLGSFDASAVSVRVRTAIDGVATTSPAVAHTFDASWAAAWTPSTYSGAIVSSTVGDVDNDGMPDLVTVEANTNLVYWARGDGTGRFGAAVAFNIDMGSLNLGSVVVANTQSRWDGSRGMNDIIVADRNADRAVVLQIGISPDNGQPYLLSFNTIDAVCGGSGPWVSDIEVSARGNDNGAVNLFFACPTARTVAVRRWSGQMWEAQSPINTAAYGAPRSLASGDFDWDGNTDLAIGLATGGVLVYGAPISVDYQPFFQIANATGVKAVTDIAVGDLDRDGFLDIAFIDDEATLRRAHIVFGAVVRDGQGVVTRLVDPATMVPVTTTGLPTQLELGDLDRDGTLDLALAFIASDSVGVLRSNTWRTGVAIADTIATGSTVDGPNSLTLADLNNDRYPDLTVSRRSTVGTQRIGAIVTTPRADCDDAFSGSGDGATFDYPLASTIVFDVDRDGHNDLVHALGEGNIGGAAITYGRGNGRFAADEAVVFTSATTTQDVGLADLDGDGDIDLAAIDAGRVVIFRQGGRYTWSAATGLSVLPNATGDLKVADVDLDRRADLVWIDTNGQTNDSFVHVWLQGAAGVFTAASWSPIALGDDAEGIALADLDVDGVLDLAFTSYRGGAQTASLCAVRSNGVRSWPAVTDADCTTLTDLFLERFVGFADVDADPELELVLEVFGANQTPTVQIRSASATGVFDQVEDDASGATQPAGHQRCGGRDVAFGTYGADGSFGLDLALRCSGAPFITVFGRTPTGFEIGTRLAYGQELYRGSLAFGDFNGDHRNDLVTGATVIVQGDVPALYDYGGLSTSSDAATMADFDGNGFLDVAALPGSLNALDITRQVAGSGGFFVKPTQDEFDANPWGNPHVGDFDGDGRPDLTTYYYQSQSDQGVLLLRQEDVDGTRFWESTFDVGRSLSITFTEPSVGDYDANGLDDVALAVRDTNNGIRISFLRQFSPGEFSQYVSATAARSVSAIASGRLRKPTANYGNTQAVALAGTCGDPERVCVVIVSDTNCDFAQCNVTELFPKNPDSISAIGVGDINKDGLDDIAIVQSAEDDYPTIFLQTAAGTFAEVFFSAAATPMFKGRADTIAIVDINGDGWGDVVSRTSSTANDTSATTVEIFVNLRTTPLTLSIANRYESFGYRAHSLFIGDLVRTGQTALGAAYAGTNQLVIKK